MPTYYVGVDLGGTKTAYGLFNENKEIVDTFHHSTNSKSTAADIMDEIVSDVKKMVFDYGITFDSVGGIGIGIPSYVDYETGYINISTNIKGLRDFMAKDYLVSKLGVRVELDNDAHCAAIAEHRYGAGRGFRHMLYCAVSTGISNGIIIHNKLFRGSYGAAGESGHMLITPNNGIMCGCGNRGCFMSYTSGSMVIQHIQQQLELYPKTSMLELAGGDPHRIDAVILGKAAQSGDSLAVRCIDRMAEYLGIWVYNLYQVLNINCYVFGGGLVQMGDLLFSRVRTVFENYRAPQTKHEVYFKYAELGSDFGLVGAVELLFDTAT